MTRQTCFSQWDTIFGGFGRSMERHGYALPNYMPLAVPASTRPRPADHVIRGLMLIQLLLLLVL